MYNSYNGYSYTYGNDSRFGGALVPFVLGGIAGSLWNGSGNNNGVVYYPYPAPYPYPVNTYQYPYYQYNTYY